MKLDTRAVRTYLPWLNQERAHGHAHSTLSRMTSEMIRGTHIERFIPTDLAVGRGGVGAHRSFLLGRWVQAPISDRREADT